MLNESL